MLSSNNFANSESTPSTIPNLISFVHAGRRNIFANSNLLGSNDVGSSTESSNQNTEESNGSKKSLLPEPLPVKIDKPLPHRWSYPVFMVDDSRYAQLWLCVQYTPEPMLAIMRRFITTEPFALKANYKPSLTEEQNSWAPIKYVGKLRLRKLQVDDDAALDELRAVTFFREFEESTSAVSGVSGSDKYSSNRWETSSSVFSSHSVEASIKNITRENKEYSSPVLSSQESDRCSNSNCSCSDTNSNSSKSKKKMRSNIIASILDTSYIKKDKQNKKLVDVINKIIDDEKISKLNNEVLYYRDVFYPYHPTVSLETLILNQHVFIPHIVSYDNDSLFRDGRTTPPIKPLNVNLIRGIVLQLARAVFIVHRNGRTLKNIRGKTVYISPELTVFVAEFRDLVELHSDEVRWYAPERVADVGLKEKQRFIQLVDIWSIGCIAYFLATGRRPLEEESDNLKIVAKLKAAYLNKEREAKGLDSSWSESLTSSLEECKKDERNGRHVIGNLDLIEHQPLRECIEACCEVIRFNRPTIENVLDMDFFKETDSITSSSSSEISTKSASPLTSSPSPFPWTWKSTINPSPVVWLSKNVNGTNNSGSNYNNNNNNNNYYYNNNNHNNIINNINSNDSNVSNNNNNNNINHNNNGNSYNYSTSLFSSPKSSSFGGVIRRQIRYQLMKQRAIDSRWLQVMCKNAWMLNLLGVLSYPVINKEKKRSNSSSHYLPLSSRLANKSVFSSGTADDFNYDGTEPAMYLMCGMLMYGLDELNKEAQMFVENCFRAETDKKLIELTLDLLKKSTQNLELEMKDTKIPIPAPPPLPTTHEVWQKKHQLEQLEQEQQEMEKESEKEQLKGELKEDEVKEEKEREEHEQKQVEECRQETQEKELNRSHVNCTLVPEKVNECNEISSVTCEGQQHQNLKSITDETHSIFQTGMNKTTVIKNEFIATQNVFCDLPKYSTNSSDNHAIMSNPLVCPPLEFNSTEPQLTTTTLDINTCTTNKLTTNSYTVENIVESNSNDNNVFGGNNMNSNQCNNFDSNAIEEKEVIGANESRVNSINCAHSNSHIVEVNELHVNNSPNTNNIITKTFHVPNLLSNNSCRSTNPLILNSEEEVMKNSYHSNNNNNNQHFNNDGCNNHNLNSHNVIVDDNLNDAHSGSSNEPNGVGNARACILKYEHEEWSSDTSSVEGNVEDNNDNDNNNNNNDSTKCPCNRSGGCACRTMIFIIVSLIALVIAAALIVLGVMIGRHSR